MQSDMASQPCKKHTEAYKNRQQRDKENLKTLPMCCCDILEALHILVVDLFHYEPTKSCFCTTIGDWLDLITSRILKPRIMIVPTHLDEFDSSDKSEVKNRCDDILERVRQYGVAQIALIDREITEKKKNCLLYTSPSPRDLSTSRMPSSA